MSARNVSKASALSSAFARSRRPSSFDSCSESPHLTQDVALLLQETATMRIQELLQKLLTLLSVLLSHCRQSLSSFAKLTEKAMSARSADRQSLQRRQSWGRRFEKTLRTDLRSDALLKVVQLKKTALKLRHSLTCA